jgi:thymidylate synthase (FAD)
MSVKHFLNGNGFVERLEVFGNDLSVVNAARVSFAKESVEMSLADEKLIRYLARNAHITPFFHPQIRFRLRMPIFVAREWFRHTIGFARNEVSRRYVDDMPECWKPVDALRLRDKSVKQGSQDALHPDENAILSEWSAIEKQVLEFYDGLLKKGIAPEVARGILPQSMYTEFIETGSLYAYARLCKLRLDSHAQKEIREYAEKIHQSLIGAFPVSWKYLMEDWAAVAEEERKKKEAAVTAAAVIASPMPPLEKEETFVISTEETKVGYISDEIHQIQLESNLVGHFGIGC